MSEFTSNESNEYRYISTGSIWTDKNLKALIDNTGQTYGFCLPDGRNVDIAVGFRVVTQQEDGQFSEEILTSDKELESIGLFSLDYSAIHFESVDNKNPEAEEGDYL